jgi:hypothetical protein
MTKAAIDAFRASAVAANKPAAGAKKKVFAKPAKAAKPAAKKSLGSASKKETK